jgi:hypothetical protein
MLYKVSTNWCAFQIILLRLTTTQSRNCQKLRAIDASYEI